ncbi:DUF6119 family protein [Tessaracoccus antarcticus]|uniref:Sporadically distributed protein, TIGR04141 family n=1 Tax=Tessaracoccus antarcticus TaxID=2479848 RepID=A0A3M0FY67_9ACTN|nr:DUF6119 family protein [Tessaracoccus antarcticus]RMB57465.1 hypothetical protein EAX62_15590 [Tessaracoccus antarcticus]
MATRSISVYLLKNGMPIDSAVEESHTYQEVAAANSAPSGTRAFVFQGAAKQPWWRDYFELDSDLAVQSSSAVIFIPIQERIVALAFGYGHHLIRDEAFDHEFGTKVVLNAVDPAKLKSTDTLDPESSQRRRTQIPFDGDLSLLSYSGDSSVLKSITGKAKAEYQDLVRSVTGATSLRLSTPADFAGLTEVLSKVITLGGSDAYLATFPEVAQIRPVTDPDTLTQLDQQVIPALFDTSAKITLTVPDVLDYSDESYVSFSGAGPCEVFEDVYIKHYREYLTSHGLSSTRMSSEDLRRHALILLDGNEQPRRKWSIYKSLVFEASLEKDGYSYHLSDGTWYRVADALVDQLRDYLDPFWIATHLPPYDHSGEAAYNEDVGCLPGMVCLDQTNISMKGQTSLEPCDLLRISDDELPELLHVKVGTSSDTLSHLFNQGVNSMQMLRTEDEAVSRLNALLQDRTDEDASSRVTEAISKGRCSVSFVIVTHKRTTDLKSEGLPIFSRISLRRALRNLRAMGISATVQFVQDKTDRAGRRKKRRAKEQTPKL